jgi:hypothetical protein
VKTRLSRARVAEKPARVQKYDSQIRRSGTPERRKWPPRNRCVRARSLLGMLSMQRSDATAATASTAALARLHGALDAAEAMTVLIDQLRQSEPLTRGQGRVRRVSELVAEGPFGGPAGRPFALPLGGTGGAGDLLRSLIRDSRDGRLPAR